MKKKAIWTIIFIVYLAVVFTLCLVNFGPMDDMPSKIAGIDTDKIVHFLMFAPFPFLCYKVFHRCEGKPYNLVGFVLLALVIGLLLGGGIELLQGAVGRNTDIMDFRADALGIGCCCVGLLIYSAVSRKW